MMTLSLVAVKIFSEFYSVATDGFPKVLIYGMRDGRDWEKSNKF